MVCEEISGSGGSIMCGEGSMSKYLTTSVVTDGYQILIIVFYFLCHNYRVH